MPTGQANGAARASPWVNHEPIDKWQADSYCASLGMLFKRMENVLPFFNERRQALPVVASELSVDVVC